MPSIVFIGGFTPMQKVLYELNKVGGLRYLALYTHLGENTAIEQSAGALKIPLHEIGTLKTIPGKNYFRDLGPDWIFNVNSTIILPKDILSVPRCGALNLHPGKLPEYAGLHVHQWAIRNAEDRFASTIHWMEAKVDTGPVAYSREFPVTPEDTGLSLLMKCMKAGSEIVLEALRNIAAGKCPPKKAQDLSKRTLYTEQAAQNGNIDWGWTAEQIYNFIRAADYHPLKSPTYIPTCVLKDGRRLRVLKAKPSTLAGWQAGEIVAMGEEGVTLGTRDHRSILLTKIQLEDQSPLTNAQIAEGLGFAAGEQIIRMENGHP